MRVTGQCYWLINCILVFQPYKNPLFGFEESAFLKPIEITKFLVLPELCNEEIETGKEISFNLLLRILKQCLASSIMSTNKNSMEIQHLLDVLFILLKHYQYIEWFWDDFESVVKSQDFVDGLLDENWQDMNEILEILDDYLLPFLTENLHGGARCPLASYVEEKIDELGRCRIL